MMGQAPLPVLDTRASCSRIDLNPKYLLFTDVILTGRKFRIGYYRPRRSRTSSIAGAFSFASCPITAPPL